jgi:hypothetical protein
MSDANAPNPEPTAAPNASPGPAGTGPSPNWRDLRQQERDARRAERHAWRGQQGGHHWHGGPPIGALVLIVIGVMVLLGNFGFHLAGHWWAALILVPAVGLLVTAIRFYRADGEANGRVIGPAIGGFVLLALALSLFFGFHGAGFMWPVVLIAVGAALIARRNWWLRHRPPQA